MRVIQTIVGVALLLYGQFCAWISLQNAFTGPPARSYGFASPWPFVLTSLLGLGLAGLGTLLLFRACGGERRRPDRR